MGEAAEVGELHLTPAQGGDVDAVLARHGLGARIGRRADVPIAGPGRIDNDVQLQAPGLFAEGDLGQRRATDVAEADEEDAVGHALK
ncbi:hypothetical protein D3C71_2001180 [compost metagenome]